MKRHRMKFVIQNLQNLIFLLLLTYTEGQDDQIIADAFSGLGCFTKSNIVVLGAPAQKKDDLTKYDKKSCEEACTMYSDCAIWSFDPGDSMAYYENLDPAVLQPTLSNLQPDWLKHKPGDPACYLTNNSQPINNITMRYTPQAVTGFRTCAKGRLGYFYDVNHDQSPLTTEIMTDGANSVICDVTCKQQNYTYFSVMGGGECHCSNYFGFGGKSDESECNVPCQSMTSETCGSMTNLEVYNTGVKYHDGMCLLGRMGVKLTDSCLSMQDFLHLLQLLGTHQS